MTANGLESKCDLLRSLHRPAAPLVLPNAWDAATAQAWPPRSATLTARLPQRAQPRVISVPGGRRHHDPVPAHIAPPLSLGESARPQAGEMKRP
jgi:hypothetical protein